MQLTQLLNALFELHKRLSGVQFHLFIGIVQGIQSHVVGLEYVFLIEEARSDGVNLILELIEVIFFNLHIELSNYIDVA